jgi:putative methionine-R-sulfoxide reductase with GAF domain
VPLIRKGQVGGVLSLHSSRPNTFQEGDRVILEILAAQIEMAMDYFQPLKPGR